MYCTIYSDRSHSLVSHGSQQNEKQSIVIGYKKGLKTYTAKYHALTESKRCSNKVDVAREELLEMLVYCNSNAESSNDEVSVDSIAPMKTKEYTISLSEILSITCD
jgi:hypothetical protein